MALVIYNIKGQELATAYLYCLQRYKIGSKYIICINHFYLEYKKCMNTICINYSVELYFKLYYGTTF